MTRPFILSRANSLKVLAYAAWSWALSYALPVLAQKTAVGQVVAAEVKGLPTHENSGFLEGLFTTINYVTGIALAGALIFGLIWLLQRRNVSDDATKDDSAEPAAAEASDATKEATTVDSENSKAAETKEPANEPKNSDETNNSEKAENSHSNEEKA
ncbi:MAG: hypothetical protein Q8T09_12870 [Candidatus Melainabacteria bacterium]|nr:hypothetical protein [Candidatus Melainabacteria bacterium]